MTILRIRRAARTPPTEVFPLSISGRYLIDARGQPFLLHGDTPWSLAVQLTNSEITTYLQNTAAKGFSAILFNAIEHFYSSQSPKYDNADGNAPLTSMTDFASTLVSAYWARVDHIVNTAKSLGILCFINPAYLGFPSTEEGWDTEVAAEADADLQTYGTRLAQRYTQGNVIWCLGGDQKPSNTLRDKQWNIAIGILSVDPAAIITAHTQQTESAFVTWGAKTGYTLNTAYPGPSDVYTYCGDEYANTMAFFMIEALYEQERGTVITAAGLRKQSYQALLSGACGQFFGNSPIWHFESPDAPYPYTGTWESNLDSTGRQHQVFVKALFDAYSWHLLVPKTGTQLVTTSLSSGDSRICPALASDGSFAMVWKPASGSSTVNMAALTPSSVRARFYNTTDGTFSDVSGQPFANSGTQSITWPGERVLVLDSP